MNIARTLIEKFPDVVYSITGNDYNTLIIHEGTKPKLEQLEAAWLEVEKEDKASEYIHKRKAEYPSIDEMVIALWEATVENKRDALQVLESKRIQVKAKYPKGR